MDPSCEQNQAKEKYVFEDTSVPLSVLLLIYWAKGSACLNCA